MKNNKLVCTWGTFFTIVIMLCLVSCSRKTPDYYFNDPKVIALCQAISDNDEKKVDEILADNVYINAEGRNGMNPLSWALKANNKTIFLTLLKNGANPDIWMSKNNGTSVRKETIKMKDSDYINMIKKYKKTPGREDFSRDISMYNAIMSLSLEDVKKHVESGADINNKDLTGDTPMMMAANLNQYQIVYYLLEKGADPKLKDKMGFSIIYSIKRSNARMNNQCEAYTYLLKSVEFLDKKGIKIDLSKPFDKRKRE